MESETIVNGLLYPIWRGIPDAYKMKYARTIWGQFEDNIRSAAYTSNLARCFETLCRKLGVSIRATDSMAVAEILTSGQDRPILQALRDETTALALMVRLKNDQRKETLKREHEANADLSIRAESDGSLFDQP